MTLPTPDAQSPKSQSSYPRQAFVNHSNPPDLLLPSTPAFSPQPPHPETASADSASAPRARASISADFSHSWDLATGGLKTLTAKRELPPRQVRAQNAPSPGPSPAPSYMFLLVILACVVIMLVSGGVVLFMTLQP